MRSKVISYIVLTLIALLILIGIIQTWQDNKMFIIIPIVLFGLIFYFLKRPPAFLSKESKTRGTYQSAVRQSKAKKERPRSKTVPFKVIEGGRDDSDTPRYH
ncbi:MULTISPECIES: hypothetical protein [Paenibacillus]|uniref:hypothetical protein n=1 Tax=Paenibacillus TaxID=44249 RepID=UPI0020415962|nr:hypothetical protein [Paenibacillus camelliae]MCM3633187.1 hypothetical protein [Paenibacillus camelliae]